MKFLGANGDDAEEASNNDAEETFLNNTMLLNKVPTIEILTVLMMIKIHKLVALLGIPC